MYGDKCLDVYKAATSNGTTLVLWSCNSGDNQKWTLTWRCDAQSPKSPKSPPSPPSPPHMRFVGFWFRRRELLSKSPLTQRR